VPKRFTTCLLLSFALAATVALAGPAEDFTAGDAAYRRGDVRSAIASLRKAADAGHVRAQALLGAILDAAEQDEEAVKYLTLASDQGDAEATYQLAALVAAGEGTPKDPARARALMEKAASLGKREALHALATAYLTGGFGLTEADRASPAALDRLRQAADASHLPSIDRLALAYRKGELGLAPDVKRAEELEAKARTIRGVAEKTPPRNRRAAPPRVPGG